MVTQPTVPSFGAQREYWDERWGAKPLPNSWQLRRGAAIMSLLQELPLNRPKILDYGCGTGWFTAELASLGSAVGVDLSEFAIAEARRRYPVASFVVGNLFELGMTENEFDVVVSQEVIAHVVDAKEYLDRITRMLKPGGYLILTTANKTVMDRLDHPPDPDSHIKKWIGLRELRTLLAPRYRVLRRITIIPRGDQGFLRIVNSSRVNAMLRLIASEERLVQLKERAGWGYTLILVAQLRAQRAAKSL